MSKTVEGYEVEMVALFAHHIGNYRFLGAGNPAATVLRSGSLVVMPVSSEIEPDSESERAITDHIFAEINIPYWQDQLGKRYVYTFHIFGLPNAVPAIYEAVILKQEMATIHEIYQDRATSIGPIEIEQETTND